MSPQRFQRVREIYHAALDRPSDERSSFLEQACSGDAALQQEVQSLLKADAEAGTFMATAAEAGLDTQPAGPCGVPAYRPRSRFLRNSVPAGRRAVWVKFISPATSGWNEM